MSSNIYRYLIPATQKGLEAGFAEGNRQLDEQNRFAQQEQLHQQTLDEDAIRQQRGFDQADKLWQARFNQQDALDNKKSQEKLNQDKAKEDAKQKKLQDEAGVRASLLQNINPQTKKPYTHNEMLGALANSGFTPDKQLDYASKWGAPSGITEKSGYSYYKNKDGVKVAAEYTQKWDPQKQKYITSKTGKEEPVNVKGTDGELSLNPKIKAERINTFNKITQLKAMYDQSLKKGVVLKDSQGNVIAPDDIKAQLQTLRDDFSATVKNQASDNFNNWNNQFYNAEDKKAEKAKGTNPDPQDYWNNLKQAHSSGDLDNADFQSGIDYIRSTYDIDPVSKYGW